MDTIKTIAVAAIVGVIVLVGVSLIGGKSNNLGAVPGVNLIPTQGFENTIEVAQSAPGATTTVNLEHFQSGSTVFLSASGTVLSLPAPLDGVKYRFVVNGSIVGASMAIRTAGVSNIIEGALIVAGAVVDCDAEDTVNFIVDGENLGDFLELTSDGTKWFITNSGGLASSKMTCTADI